MSWLMLEASTGCILTQSYGEFRVKFYLLNLGKIFFLPITYEKGHKENH